MEQKRYINPLTDYGFKKVFGDEEVMKAFLTDLLEPKSPIQTITFLDKERPADTKYEHGIIYDMYCQTEDGKKFIVEMQNRSQTNFSDRILLYLSRSLAAQTVQAIPDWDYRLTPVYGIFFLNFTLKGFEPRELRTIQLKVDETGEIFSDKLKAYTLELPNYKDKPQSECKTKIDYWLYNLVNIDAMKTSIPFQSQQPVFRKVGNILDLINMTPEELERYNISLDTYRTNRAVMLNERAEGVEEGLAKGRAEGRAEGLVKGRAEGRAERDKELIVAMKSQGLSDEMIATILKCK